MTEASDINKIRGAWRITYDDENGDPVLVMTYSELLHHAGQKGHVESQAREYIQKLIAKVPARVVPLELRAELRAEGYSFAN
jgi:hypothetical protein